MLWHTQIIKSILAHPVYIGHMVQGRKKQSFYEGKRQTYVDKENWIVVRHTHEPIIDEETFEKVQQIANQRKREYTELETLTTEIANDVVKRVTVYKDGGIEIELALRDELEKLLTCFETVDAAS